MINPSFQELSEISESRYEICVMCMKRARLLIDQSKPLIKTDAQKPVTQALEEVMSGKIHSCDPGDLPCPLSDQEEEEEAYDEEKKESLSQELSADEDLGEEASFEDGFLNDGITPADTEDGDPEEKTQELEP